MSLEKIYAPVKRQLQAVEGCLFLSSQSENEVILAAVSRLLDAGGKRLRPALLLIAAEACGYTGERSAKLATVMELMHLASLIHDDVIDDTNVRRGVATINSCLGNRTSVLVGDHLYAKAVAILAEDGDPEVMRSVAETVCRMTESEAAQSLCRNNASVTEEQYLATIAGKTASLMSCCCHVGAMLGNGHSGDVQILGEYGLNLGMAFQITDDLLDVTGEPEKLGKPAGNDIRQGSLTLPFIHAMRLAEAEDREWMIRAFASGQTNDSILTRMKNMAAEYGGIAYSCGKAREYGQACKEGLESLAHSDGDSHTSLAMLVDHVVGRAG